MEADASGPCSKKAKLAKVEIRDEAPAALVVTGAPGPDHTARTERSAQPPAGADEEEAVDRISDLPDGLLGDIITLLPNKQGARTQILGSRWRHLWRSSAPLNIEDLAGVVSRIISTHLAPGRRFCVPAYYLEDRPDTVDAWLRSPALHGLQELEFCYVRRFPSSEEWGSPPLVPPPASAFLFSPTLRVLTIGTCLLPDATTQALHFPQLTHLALEQVRISECSLGSLIARCPALERLLIFYSFGFCCVRINSASLRSMGVRLRDGSDYKPGEPQFRELVIENAPCLERLLRLDLLDGLRVSVISAPKLETLGSVFREMDVNSAIIQILENQQWKISCGKAAVEIYGLFSNFLLGVTQWNLRTLGSEQIPVCTTKIWKILKIYTDSWCVWLGFQIPGSESGSKIPTKHSLTVALRRRYFGHKRTIRPNAKQLYPLFMNRENMSWDAFSSQMRTIQNGFMGDPMEVMPGRG